ncbi:RNA-binding protein, putative [Plasmodium vinckei brucechwatti]|uniref:RNA-binding protein, putative n=1 Tax=Plasmodium vinckei brucechwatti TaxID=119398 RepID=A0A6V7RS56_PLAVN|nr:RNA-binding protein, putative [Plasmodium vinckei brucechwatti]
MENDRMNNPQEQSDLNRGFNNMNYYNNNTNGMNNGNGMNAGYYGGYEGQNNNFNMNTNNTGMYINEESFKNNQNPNNSAMHNNFNMNNPNYNGGNYNNYSNYGTNYNMANNMNPANHMNSASNMNPASHMNNMNNINNSGYSSMGNVAPSYYQSDQYILNKKTAKILYIYNVTSEYSDENFIYSLCSIYGSVDTVSYMKGKNVFIVKFGSADDALNGYKNLPTHFKDFQYELRNESKKISYFSEKANSHKYVSPNLSEKKFLSLSPEKREKIMSIKQKELLRKCKEKLNEYINMFNNKNITEDEKNKLQALIEHIKARIHALNNQCDNANLGGIQNQYLSNNYNNTYESNRNVNNISGNGNNSNISNNINYNNNNNNNNIYAEGSTTIKINSLNNIQNNDDLSNYIIQNNSIFLNEHISYLSLFTFGEKYAIIKYSNQNAAKTVLNNCSMCNINAEFVPDDNGNQQGS